MKTFQCILEIYTLGILILVSNLCSNVILYYTQVSDKDVIIKADTEIMPQEIFDKATNRPKDLATRALSLYAEWIIEQGRVLLSSGRTSFYEVEEEVNQKAQNLIEICKSLYKGYNFVNYGLDILHVDGSVSLRVCIMLYCSKSLFSFMS